MNESFLAAYLNKRKILSWSQPRQNLKQLQMTQSSCFGCTEKRAKATLIWKRDRKIIQQTKFLFCRLLKFPRFSEFVYLQFEKCLFVSCFFFFQSFFDREWPNFLLVWHVPKVLFTSEVNSILLISVATQNWVDKPPLFTYERNYEIGFHLTELVVRT